jgi:cation-transporting ATPase I
MSFLDWITPALGVFGWRSRRTHVVNGRAHVELRAMTPEQHREFVLRLSEALRNLEGVLGMATIPLVERAIVAFHAERCDVQDIVALVERTEAECGVEYDAPFPTERAEHPGDLEPLLRCLVELSGDVLGLATALAGQLSPARVLPIEINALAVLAFFDVPRLRAFLDEHLGRQATNLSLALGSSFLQGLAQSPLGPLVDIIYHTLVVAERVAGRRAWAAREPMLCDSGIEPPSDHESPPAPRPTPLPAGPIEKYADAALFASLGAFGLGLASSGSVVKATSTLFGGLPKPARLGREAFAAYLARQLALRGIIVFDADVLRRLDRVDCLVLEAALAVRAERVLDDVVVLDDGVDAEEARRQMAALFDPGDPEAPRQRGEWTLAPLEIQNGIATPRAEAWLRQPHAPRSRLHVLRRGDTLLAIGESRVLPDPDAEVLLATARRAGMRVVIAGDGVELPADETVPGERVLPETVRRLQADGRVVCVVANGAARGLAAADCGVGITLPGEPPPFGAHLLGGSSLDDAAFVVDACVAAREVASQSAALAAAGAGTGLFLSLGGLSRQTPSRVMTAVNIATIVAVANGVRVSAGLWFRPVLQRRDTTSWHGLDIESVLARLGTSVSGLPSTEAFRRLQLPVAPPTWLVALGRAVVEQLQTPLTPLLTVGAGLSAAVGSLSDAGLILGVLGLNALIGGVQAVRTESAITRLGATHPRRTCVRRDGREVLIDPAHVVPGDVVLLRGGDPVPADCRIIEAAGLEADESSLTGESLPVAKAAEPCFASTVAERRSMLYGGTSIAAGEALGVVVAVGEQTEAQRGAHVAGAHEPVVGVEARLDSLTSFMMPVAVVGGALASIAGAMAGRPVRDVLATGVSLTVAAVPEGLPMLAIVAQLGAARRLARRGVLVRHPRAIEALGRVNIVCVDKTGTMTEGRIHLHAISLGDGERAVGMLGAHERRVVGAGLRATPEVLANHELAHLTDRALVDGAARIAVTIEDNAVGWRRLAEIPFEPARGFHAVLGRTNGELLMNVKGAPEVIVARCQAWARPDGVSLLARRVHGQSARRSSSAAAGVSL